MLRLLIFRSNSDIAAEQLGNDKNCHAVIYCREPVWTFSEMEAIKWKMQKLGPILERKGKVKCTLVQALRLCTGRTVHRGSRGIAVLYRH